MRILQWQSLDEAARAAALRRPAQAAAGDIEARVEAILATVRDSGDTALRELTAQFDGVVLDDFEVPDDSRAAAAASLPVEARAAIDRAAANIRRFHAAQRPAELCLDVEPGVSCRRLWRPIEAVGLYVPGGSAPLPSTALMLGIPATLAGCRTRIMCTPPRPDGSVDPAILYAAEVAGIQRVFRLGGAQAVAAMAFGTESVPAVDKLFGPGNAYVTAAKQRLAARADGAAIDMPAGPSEVLVIADAGADPDAVAADLLSQAEHGPDSQVLLLTPCSELADAVRTACLRQLDALPRAAVARRAIEASALIVVPDLLAALALSNRYAPEHLILNLADADVWLPHVQHAGSVFLGRYAPESMGDYCSGTNHVLPTYGFARNYSSLGLDAFMKSMTVQSLSRAGLKALGPTAVKLARLEQLEAHARAVECRLVVEENPA